MGGRVFGVSATVGLMRKACPGLVTTYRAMPADLSGRSCIVMRIAMQLVVQLTSCTAETSELSSVGLRILSTNSPAVFFCTYRLIKHFKISNPEALFSVTRSTESDQPSWLS